MPDKPFQYQQTYKNRAEALERLIHAKGLPVSQGKFYPDALKHGLVQADKSLQLADLLNYVEQHLKLDPVTGQSLLEINHGKEMADLDLKEKRLKVEKLEREKEQAERELDRDWKHREEADEDLAAILGVLLDAIDHHLYRGIAEIIHVAGGDPARSNEVYAAGQAIISAAVAETMTSGRIDGTFETVAEDHEP